MISRLTLLSGVWLLCSCQAAVRFVKARPVPLSPFLEHREQMVQWKNPAPFFYTWRNPNPRAWNRARSKTQVYIAPATLAQLRPMKNTVGSWEDRNLGGTRPERRTADFMRNEFARAFWSSPSPRYRVASQPGRESLTLELALIELNPTSGKGNAAKVAAKIIFGPIATVAGFAVKTGGNIAIEGRVRNSATGEAIYEFADNESDKLTFYSLRDFAPYAHAMVAVEDWAEEFEEITRTPPGRKVDDAGILTLAPW